MAERAKFRIKSVTRQPLGVENPYSSDIVEFSANPAVCRWVKTCHLSWWRHEFYALRQGDTWPERKRNVGSPTLLLQKLGEHSFAKNIGFNLNYFWKLSDQLHLSWTSQHVVVVQIWAARLEVRWIRVSAFVEAELVLVRKCNRKSLH